jgi:hypothetical protein
VGEVTTLFCASSCRFVDPLLVDHFVTDGPFMYRSVAGELFMIWSSFIKGNYAEMVVKFKDGRLCTEFEHLTPMLDSDGGHGMVFRDLGGALKLTLHQPNKTPQERMRIYDIEDTGERLSLRKR